MFEGWDSFYLMIGGSAGALIGLMFVVASLQTDLDRKRALAGADIYMTPIVVGLSAVVVASALTLVPGLERAIVAGVVIAMGLAGAVYSLVKAWRLRFGREMRPPHWSDIWCYGVAPVLAYAALVAAGVTLAGEGAHAPRVLAAVLVAMLLLAIRNAWDLVTWLAPGGNVRGGG
jgi:hypothetical protein